MSLTLLLKIGFLPVSIWDLLDILIVSYLLYQLYKLVKNSSALNIFIGVITIYVLYYLVGLLGMEMLRAILAQFVSVGVIIIVIIFQPEIRRFLVLLGNNTIRQRSQMIKRLFGLGSRQGLLREEQESIRNILKNSILEMSRRKTGALIVLTDNFDSEPINTLGTRIDGRLSEELIRTIFDKHSPLHDGAMFIERGLVVAAGCVLPVTERSDLPQSIGLRHRAAVGFSERSQSTAFIVSEETGRISVARQGRLQRKLNESTLEDAITLALSM